jgi:hypothetical protein
MGESFFPSEEGAASSTPTGEDTGKGPKECFAILAHAARIEKKGPEKRWAKAHPTVWKSG